MTDSFIMRKQTETLGKIDMAVRAADAWKATTLLDVTTDYKPLLVVEFLLSIKTLIINLVILEHRENRKVRLGMASFT